MSSRGKNFVMALVISAILIGIFYAVNAMVPQPTVQRVCVLLGGILPSGIIQLFTYVAFFWGIFEINDRQHKINYERQGLDLKLLPETEDWVMTKDEVMQLKEKVKDQEQQAKYLLTGVIKKAIRKFQSSRSDSTGDMLDVVSTQIKINMTKAESKQSLTRYLAWAIPSIGFIGTIMGIAQALGFADQAGDEEGLKMVTDAMYVAFDTTLLSLFLSIILMWFFHNLQESEDDLHSDMEEYVIENLVNRIHLD